MHTVIIDDIIWTYILRQILEYIACLATYKQIVSFISFLFKQMAQGQSYHKLRSSFPKITTSIYNITAFQDRVNQTIEHQ